jgi:hypothetical protein
VRRARMLAAVVSAGVLSLALTACDADDDRSYIPTPTVDNSYPQDRAEALRTASTTGVDYDDADNFAHLGMSESVSPGSNIGFPDTTAGSGRCTVGWVVASSDVPDDRYAVTTGHCTHVGDAAEVIAPVWEHRPIGKTTQSSYTGTNTLKEEEDYALVSLTGGDVPSDNETNIRGLKLGGVKPLDWVTATEPYMCVLAQSGLSCGLFKASTNPATFTMSADTEKGDSGGAVWAYDPDDPTTIYAVGILQGTLEKKPRTAIVKPLQPILDQFDLTLAK